METVVLDEADSCHPKVHLWQQVVVVSGGGTQRVERAEGTMGLVVQMQMRLAPRCHSVQLQMMDDALLASSTPLSFLCSLEQSQLEQTAVASCVVLPYHTLRPQPPLHLGSHGR